MSLHKEVSASARAIGHLSNLFGCQQRRSVTSVTEWMLQMKSSPSKEVNHATIVKALQVFCGHDVTFETRCLGVDGRKTRTDSGYFDSAELAANAVYNHAIQHTSDGIYFVVNPLVSSLLARAANRIQPYAKTTTADCDIQHRRWLFLDLDPVRPSGISSTSEEHDSAIQRANDIFDFLKRQGFPEAVIADSGNGAHLHIPIDLPNTPESTAIVKAALQELARRFNDNIVSVDESVFNAARICRLYGPWASKGDHTDNRPHRQSQLIYVPDYLQYQNRGWNKDDTASTDLLLKLASENTKTTSVPGGGARTKNSRSNIDLEQLLREQGIEYQKAKGTTNFPVKLHVQCPFNDSHINKDAYVAQRDSGALIFHCSHKSCSHNGWKEFKKITGIELHDQERPCDASRQNSMPNDEKEAPGLLTVKASEVQPKELDWLWQNRFLIGNVNIIAGDPGLGKSMILVDVAARATSGRAFPDGSPCTKCSVLYSTTEDGIEDTVVPRLIAAGADLDRVHIVQGVKSLDQSEMPLWLSEHMAHLDKMLTEYPDITVLVIDTLQSHIGSNVATNNNASVRGVMTPLKRLAEKHHVAVLCIEHLTKAKSQPGENATYRVQGSIAFAGAARSVWIVAKDQEDPTGKRRYVQASKTNLAPDDSGLGLSYEIQGPTGRPYIKWIDTNIKTPIGQLLRIPDAQDEQSGGSELNRCRDWLREILTEPLPAKEVAAWAKSEMIAPRTLKRAKKDLKIPSRKMGEEWYWFPTADMEQQRTNEIIAAAES